MLHHSSCASNAALPLPLQFRSAASKRIYTRSCITFSSRYCAVSIALPISKPARDVTVMVVWRAGGAKVCTLLNVATIGGVLACLLRHFRASLASLPLLGQPLGRLPVSFAGLKTSWELKLTLGTMAYGLLQRQCQAG